MSTEQRPPGLPSAAELLEFFRSTAGRPMSPQAVAGRLELPGAAVDGLRAALGELADRGRLVETREGRFGLPERMNLVVGRLTCHPDGYGFVARDEGGGPDVFIPNRKLGDAMHEDRVIARLEREERRGKPQGRVIRVLERARRGLVGTFEAAERGGWVIPRDKQILWDVFVAADDAAGARDGQVVHVEIREFPGQGRSPAGRVREVLGDPGDPRIDVEIVIREYGLPHAFEPEVEAEAERVTAEIGPGDLEGRRDFRRHPTVTIDGESAQDFDDAVDVSRLENGNYRLAVHIADVSAYVRPGSAIDREALARGTSVYFPRRVVPMLPEVLSNGVCSLRPGEDRLAHSVVMEIDASGRTVDHRIHDSVIRSSARMTYRQVAAILDGDGDLAREFSDHVEQFRLMEELCRILMASRRQRGSLDFDLPEPEVVIDMRGEVESIHASERNIAHRIIEEFMIRTNEVVASHLAAADHRAVYRIHDGPDPERLEEFADFVAGIGHTLGGGDDPKPRHFQRVIDQLEGRPEQAVVSMLLLSVMQQARYSPDNIGHFGLASERYCHFTSPIRRYPDLVVHRLLRHQRGSVAAGDLAALDLSEGRLARISAECSAREREAEKAERDYLDWKKVQFMADKLGREYTGYVVGVQAFGLFVQLRPHLVSGLVHVSTLGDDYYRFEPEKHRLVGENQGREFDLGDTVRVRVERVDAERRHLDLALVD